MSIARVRVLLHSRERVVMFFFIETREQVQMYVWQMNDGRWHVSAMTGVKYHAAMSELSGGFETEAEARAALRAWRERHPGAEVRAY